MNPGGRGAAFGVLGPGMESPADNKGNSDFHNPRWRSLRYKMAIPYSLLVVLAVLVPGLISARMGFDTLTSRTEETLLLSAQIAAHHLDSLLREKMAVVEGIVQLASLKHMIPAHIDEDIRRIRLHQKGFTSRIVLDTEGTVVFF